MENNKKKTTLAIILVILVLLLAGASVFIALRLKTQKQVSPTAPESKPAAADWVGGGSCSVNFEIGATNSCVGNLNVYLTARFEGTYKAGVQVSTSDGQSEKLVSEGTGKAKLTTSILLDGSQKVTIKGWDNDNTTYPWLGWIPPVNNKCGKAPFGIIDITNHLSWANGDSSSVFETQCWGDNGEEEDYNDWLITLGCEAGDPTATPTDEPTSTPTDGPTATPTDEPTSTPTDGPTATPTDEPTSTPTDGPTATPTDEPTSTPTDGPTGGSNGTTTPTTTPADGAENLPEAGILSLPGIVAFGGGLLMAVIGILLAL